MRKTLIALTAAAALTLGTFTTTPVQADPFVAWWWIPVALIGGAVVGSAVVAPAYAHPRAYAAAPRGTVRVQPSRCRLVAQPGLFGGYHYVEVCR